MKKFLLKIGIYSLIAFIVLNAIAFISLYFMGKSSLYKPEYVVNGVKENKFDYVVLGSSTGLTTLNTNQIDSITGKKGFNISIDDTSMSTHYLMLQHFYACGKTTKQLILTITPWDSSDPNPTINNNDYRFLPYVDRDYVYNYFSEMERDWFKILTFSRYFPVFGVSYYNTELFYPSVLVAFQPKKRNRFDENGNYSYPEDGSGPDEKKYSTTNVIIKNPFYSRIKKFCSENKIDLVLYQSPIYKTKVLVNGDVKLINHSELFQDASFFYDDIHVNSKGRKLCSTEMASAIFKLNNGNALE